MRRGEKRLQSKPRRWRSSANAHSTPSSSLLLARDIGGPCRHPRAWLPTPARLQASPGSGSWRSASTPPQPRSRSSQATKHSCVSGSLPCAQSSSRRFSWRRRGAWSPCCRALMPAAPRSRSWPGACRRPRPGATPQLCRRSLESSWAAPGTRSSGACRRPCSPGSWRRKASSTAGAWPWCASSKPWRRRPVLSLAPRSARGPWPWASTLASPSTRAGACLPSPRGLWPLLCSWRPHRRGPAARAATAPEALSQRLSSPSAPARRAPRAPRAPSAPVARSLMAWSR
mmetsp:Transcript_117611/g.379613  ORF Transcript_117611/g.379613 Transcript_117611/m.379613 type:complete len:286 (+) Transcript_117611:812-1669(+)